MKEESNPILSIICGDKSQLYKLLKRFGGTIKPYEIEKKFFKNLEPCKTIDFTIIPKKSQKLKNIFDFDCINIVNHFDLILKQNFNFKIIPDKKNPENYIQCKPIIAEPEYIKINTNIEYINNVYFEIIPEDSKVNHKINRIITNY